MRGSIGNVWHTIRQINISEIREQAEQPFTIALIGTPELRHAVMQTLYEGPQRRYGGDYTAVEEYDLPLERAQQANLSRSDLAVLAIEVRSGASAGRSSTTDMLATVAVPRVLLLIGVEEWSFAEVARSIDIADAVTVTAPDMQPSTLAQRLLPAIVEQLPEDQRIAAARRIPGLRDLVARRLISETSFANASYALTSGIPEMVPLLNIPLNAADMVVLTKNQALMIYKLALAFGAPPNFQAQMKEIMPVIGGGFMWRQVARQLIGLVPGFGIAPKVAVAYAGTYATGQVAVQWYRSGEVVTRDALKDIYRQALQVGKQRARELVQRQASESSAAQLEPVQRRSRRRFWPLRRRS